jgi:hypothetical protein
MTGMVKEEILTRQMELGFSIENGNIKFDFLLLDKQEFLTAPTTYEYWNVEGKQEQIECSAGSILYSICQVPVILDASDRPSITVHRADGSVQEINGYILDVENSRHIFQRDDIVHHLTVSVLPNQ